MVASVNRKTGKYPIEHYFGMKALNALKGWAVFTFIVKQLMTTGSKVTLINQHFG